MNLNKRDHVATGMVLQKMKNFCHENACAMALLAWRAALANNMTDGSTGGKRVSLAIDLNENGGAAGFCSITDGSRN